MLTGPTLEKFRWSSVIAFSAVETKCMYKEPYQSDATCA